MATDRNPDVMEMVEEELRKNPDISNKDLKLKAEDIDADIENLSARQFNARYPLQVKRKLAAEQQPSEDGGVPKATAEAEQEAGAAEEEGGEEGPSEETREKIFRMIEEALEEDPDVANDELQERAAEIDPAIADLSARSFHARYPLQVKRQMTAGRKKEEEETETAAGRAEKEEVREAVRQTLLDFAKDVAGADDRGEVIDVLTSVDEYVDRVLEKA